MLHQGEIHPVIRAPRPGSCSAAPPIGQNGPPVVERQNTRQRLAASAHGQDVSIAAEGIEHCIKQRAGEYWRPKIADTDGIHVVMGVAVPDIGREVKAECAPDLRALLARDQKELGFVIGGETANIAEICGLIPSPALRQIATAQLHILTRQTTG